MKAKQQFTNKLLAFFLCFVMFFACLPFIALQVGAEQELSDDIVILYTNDVHTYIDGLLSYDVIAAIKGDLQTKYKHVILADAGDHIQGTAYGSMDSGKSIIELMNAAGYDVATLGNHEFDYTMQGCMNAIEWAKFPYISCNFYHEENGVRKDNVLDSFVMFDCGDEKVAFVGITTPETFSKTTPVYFQDGNGNYIYGISGGDDGAKLRADVQNAIDSAKLAGATKVIALGHLGVDPSSTPWTSEETIAGVSGLNAFIDGHSHTVMEAKNVKDKDGKDVVLTQTGEYFNRIGMMVIDSETGSITTDFIEYSGNDDDGYTLTSELYGGSEIISDETVKGIKDSWMKKIDDQLGQKIGSFEVTFDNYDENGNRLVRVQGTNSGDFTADALYYLFDNMNLDVDVAVMNGGGIRNTALTGDISYKDCKNMHPFGNVACLQTVTGQQLLDMLEWGARNAGVSESGAFLHVSGLVYSINTSIPNTTKTDDKDAWAGAPDKYRVYDVMVYNKDTDSYEALDLNAKYNLAGYNYTLRDLGDGFAMLDDAVNVLDYVMEDYMVLANYINGFDGGTVKENNSPLSEKYHGLLIDYSQTNGSGRIFVSGNLQEIWVGGVKVTDENANDILGDGKVSYNATTNTLTLNGADIKAAYDVPTKYSTDKNNLAVIYAAKGLNVELIGVNKITAPDSSRLSAGILVNGGLGILGSGSLTITGGKADVSGFGIYVDGILSVKDATVEATAKTEGVHAAGGIEIVDALTVATPEKGKVSRVDGDESNPSHWTITNPDDSAAQSVVIKAVDTTPTTGDYSDTILCLALLLVSGSAAMALIKRKSVSVQ